MSKQVIRRIGFTLLLIMAISASLWWAYRYYNVYRDHLRYLYYYVFVRDNYDEPNPNSSQYYPEDKKGEYLFNSQTILSSLERGETDVFTHLLDDSLVLDVKYPDSAWNQADFLRVANALSQQVWYEPLDLNHWLTYHIRFSGDCNEKFRGFTDFIITYFKTVKTGGEIGYIARTIFLRVDTGWIFWAGDGEFSAPALLGWDDIALSKFKITADEAVRIADENGGRAARAGNDGCQVFVMPIERFYSNHGDDWYVKYSKPKLLFTAFINPFSGEIDLPK